MTVQWAERARPAGSALARCMQLDVQTLYFTNVAVLFIASAAAVFFWRRNPDETALKEWAIATGLGGLGTLVLGVFGPVPGSGWGVVGWFLPGSLLPGKPCAASTAGRLPTAVSPC